MNDKVKRIVDNAFTSANKDQRDNDLQEDEYYQSLAGYLYRAMEIYGNQQWNAALDKAAEKADHIYPNKPEDNATSIKAILSLKHKDNE